MTEAESGHGMNQNGLLRAADYRRAQGDWAQAASPLRDRQLEATGTVSFGDGTRPFRGVVQHVYVLSVGTHPAA